MEIIKPSQYFEGHSMHCPLLKAFNRFRFSPSRKNFSRFVLFVVLIYFLLNINGISDWVKGMTRGQSQDTDRQQPSDGGGVGGHSTTSNGGGHSNGNSDGGGGGGSHDPPQTPSSGGGGSSSSGDNGDDDPNKRPPRPVHKAEDLTEVESKEEENNDDNSQSESTRKGQMVTNQLQPGIRPLQTIDTSRRHGGSVMLEQQCSNTWMSSPYKGFEHSNQLRTCPAEEKAVIHESTNDEQQPQQLLQSAASIGEEQLNLDVFSVASTDSEGILEQLPFYMTIPIESFSGPQHSASQLGLGVSAESIQALHANTYYELAHLQSVQEQVLQAVQSLEPFDYTLAFVMYNQDGTQLLIPCLPHTEFDPAADVHVVAVPADHVLSHFTVRIHPHLQ